MLVNVDLSVIYKWSNIEEFKKCNNERGFVCLFSNETIALGTIAFPQENIEEINEVPNVIPCYMSQVIWFDCPHGDPSWPLMYFIPADMEEEAKGKLKYAVPSYNSQGELRSCVTES